MNKLSAVFIFLLTSFAAATSQALVLDAPHNKSNSITCTTCHTYSLWWQYSPSAKNVSPGHTAVVNAVCMKCHGSGATLAVATHSSGVIGSANNYHNGWGVGCTDCHNPHFQDQITWGGDAYLIEGKIDWTKPGNGIETSKVTMGNVEYDQTTISIVSPLTKANVNWPASTWSKKNKTTPDRGLIFALDTTQRVNTYSVISATDTEIVVKGIVDANLIVPAVDPDGTGPLPKNSSTADTFGLIYGQLIKKSVTVPYSVPTQSRSVKFFTPIGGFVDTVNSPSTGVCQVCHTLTSSSANNTARFRNDGATPDSTDSHAYYLADTAPGGTSTCTMCHSHTVGFKGSGHSPNDFGWSTISYTRVDGVVEVVNCADCHDNSKGIVEGVHNNKCGICHINPGGGGPVKVAGGVGGTGVDSANGIDADPSGEYHTPNHTYIATCADCHDKAKKPNIQNTLPQIHHDTPGNYADNGVCIKCHKSADMGATPNTRKADHTTKIAVAWTSGSYPNIVNGCGECHMLDSSTNTDYSTHGTSVGAIIDQGFDNPRVHDTCTSCHTTVGGLKSSSQVTNASRMVAGYAPGHGSGSTPNLDSGPTNCFSCHGHDPGIIHLNVNHSNTVGNTTQCNWCHYKQVGMSNGATVDPNDNMIHDACTTCHIISKGIPGNYAIGLVNPANLTRNLVGQMFTPQSKGQPVNCTDCHSIHLFKDHRKADHTAVVALSTKGCTNTCHTNTAGRLSPTYGMPVDPIDNKVHDACTSCHNTSTGELRTVAEVSLIRPNIVVAMPNGPLLNGHNASNDGGGECSACHGPSSFASHTHTHAVALQSTDLAQAAPGTACFVCHNDAGANLSTWNAILTEHRGNCSTCHSATRLTGNPGKPAETVPDVIAAKANPTACTACHCNKKSPATHGHTTTDFTWAGTCSGCHTGTDIIADVHGKKCALCHTNPSVGDYSRRVGTDGNATLAGTSNTASCIICHDTTIFPTGGIHHDTAPAANNSCTACHSAVNHSATVASTPSCNICHTATAGTSSGIVVALNDSLLHPTCRTCHTFDANKRGILVNFTNQKGVNGSGSLPDGGTIGGKNGGGLCSACHTVATSTPTSKTLGSVHHGSKRAAVGECEYCHADPRSSWGGSFTPGDSGTASGVPFPTQMACIKCHVNFTGTAMNVTKYARTDYSSYKLDWTRSTAHSIPMNGTRINNYGICLSCHYVGNPKIPTSAQLTIWHARPDKHGWAFDSHDFFRTSCSKDYAHYAPGRSSSGQTVSIGTQPYLPSSSGIGGFNLWRREFGYYAGNTANTTFAPSLDFETAYGQWNCPDVNNYFNPGYDMSPFTRITLPAYSQVGLTDATQKVPVFASLAPLSGASPSKDVVAVLSANLDGITLSVITTTSGLCSDLTVVTQPGNTAVGKMVGNATCSLTTSVASKPSSIDLLTTNPSGVNINGYPVHDPALVSGAGTISFNSSVYSVAEGEGVATITVIRSGGSVGVVTATYATVAGGTATAGTDYTTKSDTLTWAAGETGSKTFTIPIIQDTAVEGAETVLLQLSAPTGDATLSILPTAVLTIADDDSTISFKSGTITAKENCGTANVAVSRTGGSIGTVSVNYATISGTAGAYTPISGTLTWTTGDMGDKTISVPIIDNSVIGDGSKQVILQLTSPSGTQGSPTLGAQSQTILTITDNDTGVNELDHWVNSYEGMRFPDRFTNLNVGYFAVANGSDRLLMAAVYLEMLEPSTNAAPPVVNVTYGGNQLTQVGITHVAVGSGAESRRGITWMGYLPESQIGSGLQPLVLSYQSESRTAYAIHVKWGSYAGVNQVAPFASSAATSTTEPDPNKLLYGSFGNGINYVTKGITVGVSAVPLQGYNVNIYETPSASNNYNESFAVTPPFSPQIAYVVSFCASSIFSTVQHQSSGFFPGNTRVSWYYWGGQSEYVNTIVVSLQP